MPTYETLPRFTADLDRVLTSGQVSAGLTPQAAQAVVATLTVRPVVAARGKRRGLGPGFKGVASR